jgi:hypothetical protein
LNERFLSENNSSPNSALVVVEASLEELPHPTNVINITAEIIALVI